MPAGRRLARRLLARQVEEVVPFVVGQPQRAGQRGQHLAGRARAAGLFQPRVVVHRHAGELGHLLAAQPGRAAAGARGETHVGGVQPGTAAAQEVGEFGSVHPSSMRRRRRRLIQGLLIPGSTGLSRAAAAAAGSRLVARPTAPQRVRSRSC